MKQTLAYLGLVFVLASVTREAYASKARHEYVRKGRNLRKHREPKEANTNASLETQQMLGQGGLCLALSRLDGAKCPAPPGAGNACPITQICLAGGTLANFCSVRAKGCEEECESAFENCDGCTNIDCPDDDESTIIQPTTAFSQAEQLGQGGVVGVVAGSGPTTVCEAIQNAKGTCPAPPGLEASCPIDRICEYGGTLGTFCLAEASQCEEDCLTAFSKCDGCDSIDCDQHFVEPQDASTPQLLSQTAGPISPEQVTNIAIDHMVQESGQTSEAGGVGPPGSICHMIESFAADKCPAPPGKDAKCPIREICNVGNTVKDFCSSKAKDCVDECVAAFGNCDSCTDADIDCSELPQKVSFGEHQGRPGQAHKVTLKKAGKGQHAVGVSSITPVGRKKAAIKVHYDLHERE